MTKERVYNRGESIPRLRQYEDQEDPDDTCGRAVYLAMRSRAGSHNILGLPVLSFSALLTTC